MAAVTLTGRQHYAVMGNKNVVTATFAAPADTNTWDTGLKTIDAFTLQIAEASDAGDALTGTVSSGTITLSVTGTIAGAAYGMAIGS